MVLELIGVCNETLKLCRVLEMFTCGGEKKSEKAKKQFVPNLLLATFFFFFPFDIPVVFCPFLVCGLRKK